MDRLQDKGFQDIQIKKVGTLVEEIEAEGYQVFLRFNGVQKGFFLFAFDDKLANMLLKRLSGKEEEEKTESSKLKAFVEKSVIRASKRLEQCSKKKFHLELSFLQYGIIESQLEKLAFKHVYNVSGGELSVIAFFE